MADITAAAFYKAHDELRTYLTQRLDDRIDSLRVQIDSKHASLRQSMQEGFCQVGDKLETHQKDDNIIENRVTAIESRLDTEKTQAVRNTTWIALFLTALTIALKVIFK